MAKPEFVFFQQNDFANMNVPPEVYLGNSPYLLLRTATPTVLRGVAMDATKLHCLA